MKKLFVIPAFIVLALNSCMSDYIYVDDIDIYPSGGYAVESLTATLHGEGAGSHTVTVYWAWSESATGTGEVFKTDYILINGSGTYSTSYSADYGYVLVGYFWVEAYDSEGNYLNSSPEAYCYYY